MTFHLHIKGRVQGVGFRPYVYKLAVKKNIPGYISNDVDGVHMIFSQPGQKEADEFVKEIIHNAPAKSIIQNWYLEKVNEQNFQEFSIRIHERNVQPDLLISPDFAMCPQCKSEFHDTGDRRYQYPFITCTLCGPRYSIMTDLPYERHLTSMENFIQCPECKQEYKDVNDRRYFSQTNSCSICGIRLSWHTKNNTEVLYNNDAILSQLLKSLHDGKIIAVKGIGGFLLLCDAASKPAIEILRERKHRPKKPFAVLFPRIELIQQYTYLNKITDEVLQNETSPIVLLRAKEVCFEKLCMDEIAPGLTSIGVMMPYAPLLEWIMSSWKKPVVATSGNVSGSCIVFQSERKEELFQSADFILDHNRDIVIPQDDSVVRVGEKNDQQIIIRRARGMAPAIIPSSLKNTETIFAAGAMLKSAFALQHNNQVYLSQYLGNLESYDTQQNYLHTFNYFLHLLKAQPQVILADLHTDYPSTKIAEEYSVKWNIPIKKIQHHEAHFAAILGEYDLFKSEEKILGVIWDGTGLGSDGNIWGGEFFLYEKGKITRLHYLEPFINTAGDKMAREPRLSALAISQNTSGASEILKSKFLEQEWKYYHKAINSEKITNTSAGRYFDGVASLLNLIDINTYEGEAALLLEQSANYYLMKNKFAIDVHYFDEVIDKPVISMKRVISNLISDINSGKNKDEIAAKFHLTLIAIIKRVAQQYNVKNIACSGGVFQNPVLIDLVYLQLEKVFKFYFHRQMSPNDECIPFGQLMYYQNIKL